MANSAFSQSQIATPVPVASGGTGTTTLTGILSGNGTSAITGGYSVVESDITLADNATNNVTTSKHGFITKAPNTTIQFFRGDGTWAQVYAWSFVASSNATTSSTTLVDITGLSVALLANTTYEFEAQLSVTSSDTNGNAYGINYSVAGATIEAGMIGTLASGTTRASRISAFATAPATFETAGADGTVLMKGIVITGANAGNLTAQHLKRVSGTSTVYISSYLKVVRAA